MRRLPKGRIKRTLTKRFSRLRHVVKRNSGQRRGTKLYSNFQHLSFLSYKKHLVGSTIPLVGKAPSMHLNDTKPLRYWKLFPMAGTSLDYLKTNLFSKHLVNKAPRKVLKQLVRKRLRLFFMRSKTLPRLPQTSKFWSRADAYNSSSRNLRIKTTRKVYIRRMETPKHVLRSKTSYPLMFTNSVSSNKLKKNQLDVTLNSFLRPRSNRRARKFTKILFRRVKRRSLRRLRRKKTLGRQNAIIQNSTKWLLKRVRIRRYYLLRKHPRRRLSLKKKRIKYVTVKKPRTAQMFNFSRKYHKPKKLTQPSRSITTDSSNVATVTPSLLVRWKAKAQYKLWGALVSFSSVCSSPKRQLRVRDRVKGVTLYPVLSTRTGKNFTFKNFGMFLNTLTFFAQKNPFTYKFLFKKKIFSFLYPNEVRNALMNRKKRITFYKLVYKVKHKVKERPRYSLSSFNKFFLRQYKSTLANASNNLLTQDLFSTRKEGLGNLSQQHLALQNYELSQDEIMYSENFKHRGQDLSFRWTEVKIPRVRFRPGYQRMWRRARTALQESLNLKFIYQQQLTRYLVRFYKGSNSYNLSQAEMSLNRVVMYSRLLPDNPTVNAFMSQKLVYLNGSPVFDPNRILVPNDVVQLIISMWYYVTYRWISNWTLKRHKKFKKLVYRKGLASRQKVMKLKKQRSYYTPNWIHLARYDISDIKPYLEVDYFTLSAMVLYEPFQTYYSSPDEAPDYRPTIYRMYNWKYIN